MRAIILALLLTADVQGQSVAANLVPVDRADERVTAMVHFTIIADTMPDKRTGVIYFVPASLASKEEKKKNLGSIQVAAATPEPLRAWWGYRVALRCEPKGFRVEVSTDRFAPDREVQREADFYSDIFADVSVKKAGISLDLKWERKPNHTAEPASPSQAGSP
jgi:hypothetical protein